MLAKLHNIKVGACITVATFDMGFQYAYATPDGCGETFGNMGSWPAFCIEDFSNDFLKELKEKIKNKTLVEDDLGDGYILQFYKTAFAEKSPERCYENVYDFFQELVKVECIENDTLYILCDIAQWKPEAKFYGSYDDFEQGFIDEYVYQIDAWEDFSDDELEEWLDRIEDGLSGIPLVNFAEE